MVQASNAPGTQPLRPKLQTSLTDPPQRDEKVLKAGSLCKRTAHTRTWQKRWFVLRPYGLAYYKDSKEYETRRVMSLDTISGVSVKCCEEQNGMSFSPTKSKRERPLLTLYVRSRRLELLVESAEEAESWAMALREAIDANLSMHGQTSTSPNSATADTAGIFSLSETEDEATTDATDLEPEKVVVQGYLHHLLHYNHHQISSTNDRSSRSRLGNLAQYVKHPVHSAHRSRSASSGQSHSQARRMRGKRYWCVLRSRSGLFLYADSQEYKVVDILPLSDMVDWTDLELPEHEELRRALTAESSATMGDTEDQSSRMYVLQIILREESRIFAATSETALDEWLGALQSRIDWQRSRRGSAFEIVPITVA